MYHEPEERNSDPTGIKTTKTPARVEGPPVEVWDSRGSPGVGALKEAVLEGPFGINPLRGRP